MLNWPQRDRTGNFSFAVRSHLIIQVEVERPESMILLELKALLHWATEDAFLHSFPTGLPDPESYSHQPPAIKSAQHRKHVQCLKDMAIIGYQADNIALRCEPTCGIFQSALNQNNVAAKPSVCLYGHDLPSREMWLINDDGTAKSEVHLKTQTGRQLPQIGCHNARKRGCNL